MSSSFLWTNPGGLLLWSLEKEIINVGKVGKFSVLPFSFNDYEDYKDKVDSTEYYYADQQYPPSPVTERSQERLVQEHIVPPYKQPRVKVPDYLGHINLVKYQDTFIVPL